jgi:hypothetical protein
MKKNGSDAQVKMHGDIPFAAPWWAWLMRWKEKKTRLSKCHCWNDVCPWLLLRYLQIENWKD